MDALLAVIIVLGVALLVVTAYMEWIGLMNLFTPRSPSRYGGCGHLMVAHTNTVEKCWRCRHAKLTHPHDLLHH